jgi:two-component system sensor histidine kinase BarA
VLVADDSAVNREVIIEALKQMQVAADVVEDGMAAVQAATEKIYHLIFMDCSMPEMDGFEATRRIRAAEKDSSQRVPIVALSAHVAGAGADEWREAGMDSYLSKPFRINDLVETFEEFLPEEMRQTEADMPSNYVAQISEAAVLEHDDDELPIIDSTVLRDAIGCEPDERSDLLLRVLSLFEQHGPPALLKIAESASDQNNSEIGDAAHALKSMCRNIGAVRLAAACDRLETDAKNNHLENLTAQLCRLQKELVTALDVIKKLKGSGQEKIEKAILNV